VLMWVSLCFGRFFVRHIEEKINQTPDEQIDKIKKHIRKICFVYVCTKW